MEEQQDQRKKRDEELVAAYKAREDLLQKVKGFNDLKIPVKLTKSPYFNGKAIVVGDVVELSTDNLLEVEQTAMNISEIGTIIRTKNLAGKKLGEYRDLNGSRRGAIYSFKCEVSIIDFTIPAVIAKKTFENKNAPMERQVGITDRSYFVPPPTSEIKAFIASLPQK